MHTHIYALIWYTGATYLLFVTLIYVYIYIYLFMYTYIHLHLYVNMYICAINNRCSLPAPATHGMALSKFGQRMHSCHRCCFLAGCSTYCKTYIHILLYIYILCYVYTHQPFRNPNIFCYVNIYQVISYSVYVHCFTWLHTCHAVM